MKKFCFISLSIFCVISVSAFSQEKQKKINMSGYLSLVTTSMFDSISGQFINDNLIHNRLNFKGYINDNLTFAAEFRNRLFTGDMVRSGSSYAAMISTDPGLMDLSWNVFNEQSFFFNTTIDRIWFDMNYNKFQARIGRQRINLGQTLVWNPNDIFNAYSFFDFDYIERPGSDAIRLQYYPGPSSALEFAIKADRGKKVTAAALYRFNKWAYDIQFLGGIVNEREVVAGMGWSGAFGSVSFRGEGSWFQPIKTFSDTTGTGIFTIGFDKIFKNNSMAQAQVMVCNNPLKPENFLSLYSGNLSVKDLAFSKFTAFGQFSYPVTQLFNAGISGMWFPGLNGWFSGISGDYSVAENVDVSVLWQHFYSRTDQEKTRINIGFLRVKFSF
jgi:hypothetical protein